MRLYPGIEEDNEADMNGDWKTLEKICLDLLFENNAISIAELISGIEVQMGLDLKCRVN